VTNSEVSSTRRRCLTIEQVAEELSVGEPTVRQLLKSGELRGLQIGGRGMRRVAAARDLEDYIDQAYRSGAERSASRQGPSWKMNLVQKSQVDG
jgi:excisionase family DNA binding protein